MTFSKLLDAQSNLKTKCYEIESLNVTIRLCERRIKKEIDNQLLLTEDLNKMTSDRNRAKDLNSKLRRTIEELQESLDAQIYKHDHMKQDLKKKDNSIEKLEQV